MKKQLNGIRHGTIKAFTLVELLVVIAIIAMLLSILMPSLQKARAQAYAIKCGANMRNCGIAMLSYTTDYEYFPCSYVYPNDAQGDYDLNNQTNKSFGYLHWSYFVAAGGRCDKSAFSCPAIKHQGIPRTNPGSNPADWESGQIDNAGQTLPNSLADKQAPRMALTANSMIIPRNKFNGAAVSADGGNYTGRVSKFVKPGEIKNSGRTILATEFSSDWKSITDSGSGQVVKSHRPVDAVFSQSAGQCGQMFLYQSPLNMAVPDYVYGDPGDPTNAKTRGVKKLKDIAGKSGIIDGSCGSTVNAVGRNHPGQGETTDYGGCANFVYIDGHVERKTIMSTMVNFEWGTKFYSMTGNNSIDLRR